MSKNKFGTIKMDVIIIGGGISGLYTGYQIPDKSFLILEKNTKEWLGGRAGNQKFYGSEIVIGAYSGRKEKDHRLINLLKETKTPYTEDITNREYAHGFEPMDIYDVTKTLKKEYRKEKCDKTFKQFSISVLGRKKYNDFITTTGYTDFENSDTYDTLYHYGMDDNIGGWVILRIPWKELSKRLYKKIGGKHFRFSTEVESIENIDKDLFEVVTTTGEKYYSRKVVVATTIETVRKIVPGASDITSIYQQIHGQPFLLVYAKFDKVSSKILRKYVPDITIVSGPLQKIYPIDPDNGVYIIASTDNDHATFLKDITDKELYVKWTKEALEIPDKLHIIGMRHYYWECGTHYYEPLCPKYSSRPKFIRKAQNPVKDMFIVGEMVARHQGWVEGALESVDAVIDSIAHRHSKGDQEHHVRGNPG